MLCRHKFVQENNICNHLLEDCYFLTVNSYHDIDPHQVMTDQSNILVDADRNKCPNNIKEWLEKEFNINTTAWKELVGLKNTSDITLTISEQKTCVVSDGSYCNKFGTSATVISNRGNNEIWAKSVTPGPSKSQNPHCRELASVTTIATICATYNIQEEKILVCLDHFQPIVN